eukprot:TRINITY_DN1432_c0_g1_i1.p1 TRINITY_DN1432_c0_g1~~TRINITY_DN1432_c0_g1_i1.p1  ORF type:complete len:405 (-),score=174.25 TRINITY_DN1432_c0_g1_i1:291-1505(-)
MAPKAKGTKRAAAEMLDQLAVELKEKGTKRDEYDAVLEAVNHPLAGDLNPSARKMLAAMILQGLCVPAEQRHQVQVAAVQMLTSVFETIVTNMKAEIDDAAAALTTAEASKAALDEKVAAAEASSQEASETAYSKKTACAEAAKAVMDAKASLAEAEKQKVQGDAAHEEAKSYKAELEKVFGQDFRLLRDGEAEEEAAQGHFDNLQTIALTLGIDDSLVNAMASCMLKKPSARGSFDTMVVSQLQEGFTNKVAEITATIENGAPAAASRQAAVDAAAQHLSSMKQAQHVAADAMSAAFETEKSQKAAAQVNKDELAEFMPTYKKAVAARNAKEDQLSNFKDWNLANLEVLRDREGVPAKKAKQVAADEENLVDGVEVDEANAAKTVASEVSIEATAQEAVVAGA